MKRLLRQIKTMSLAVEAGPFTAIDFDRRQLRIVHADHRGTHIKVRAIEAVDVPAGVDAADPAAMGAFIGRTLRGSPLRGGGVVMSVPREQAILKSLTLPPDVPPSELAAMVLFQVEKELPVHLDEAAVDFTLESHYDADGPAPAESGGTGVLVAAVRLPAVEHYRKVAAAAKVKLLRLGLRPYANACCVEACAAADRPGCFALVHLTADEAETDVLVDGALAFSRSAVVKVPPAGAGERERAEAVEAVVLEVSRGLGSYQAVQRERKIERVLIAGGTGLEAGVCEELARRLEIGCGRFEPAAALGLKAADGASGFVAALGLALGHRRGERLPFDFLHPKRPPVRRDTARIRRVALGGGAAAAACVLIAAGWLNLHSKRAEIAALDTRRAELAAQKKDVVDPLAKRVKALDGWTGQSRNWLDQWALLSGVFPPPSEAYVTALRVGADQSINFTVKARSAEVVTDLGRRLTAAGYDYKPGPVSIAPEPHGYNHTADVKVMLTPRVKIDLAALRIDGRPEDDVSGFVSDTPPAAPPEASRDQTSTTEAQPDTPPPAEPDGARGQPAREGQRPEWRRPEGAGEGERPWRRRRREQ